MNNPENLSSGGCGSIEEIVLAEEELTSYQKASGTESPQSHQKIIAAIPCFNEERFIGSVVVKAKKCVDTVIVIDDGSTDATGEVACEAGAVVYRHGQNKGYGAAIRSAIEKGRELGADVMVVLDGDGQHDPKDIPHLIKAILDGEADVVLGSRFQGKYNEAPFYRHLGQRVLTTATNMTSGYRVSDSQSGFRAYSSKALDALNLYRKRDVNKLRDPIQYREKRAQDSRGANSCLL